MDVSVIVPTRNRCVLLPMTLRTALCQQDVDIEVIVVDDASTDDTRTVLSGIADPRLRVLKHETARGVSAARNSGAVEARGEWLAFLDDDDLWAPDKLARQLQAASESRREWAYTGAVVINRSGRILRSQKPLPPDQMVSALRHYDAIPGGGSNIAIRKTAWQQIGPFDSRLRSGEDWELCIRLARHGLPGWVNLPLIAKRIHPSNSTLDVAEIVRGTKLIETLHHTTADWGRLHRWMAYSSLRAGHPGVALVQFAQAAFRGQARAVASDIGAILQQMIGRVPTAQRSRGRSDEHWVAAATAWLRQLPPDA